MGLCTGIPDGIMVELLPWYPTGMCNQFGNKAFSGSRNTAHRMNLEDDKVLMNIEKYGNTTSATLPLVLYDFEHVFKKGDTIIFAAFGGGFTWGSIYLTWAYDKK